VESLQFLNLKIFCISFIDFFTAPELTKGPKKLEFTACLVLLEYIPGKSWSSEK
jgi:hypothetical protein